MADTGYSIPKNYIRLSLTVGTFLTLYGHFPTSALVGYGSAADIREPLSDAEWDSLNRRLPITINAKTQWFVEVRDDRGLLLNYNNIHDTVEQHYADADEYLGALFKDNYCIL